ncbi:hypothetical protein L226DRAFT_534504 [Lentinus tigrinus ALCF2SS1-7]|uniref:uncharacterized protein n=1 Tax=Lentinus tigrinus ALCF2SS1-7 TaxID=1328758 RepID=UPI0011660C72|nr:hypothetical protein L226DRAFT_534504 [Lentinus tigrinus ALCF2SS1-7]
MPTASNLGSVLHARHFKTQRKLSDIIWTTVPVLRVPASYSRYLLGTILERCCRPPLSWPPPLRSTLLSTTSCMRNMAGSPGMIGSSPHGTQLAARRAEC